MMADFLVLCLARFNLALSAAILLVLVMRPLVRRLLGPELAYLLWVLPPVAAVTSLFPTLGDFISVSTIVPRAMHISPDRYLSSDRSPMLLDLYAAGAVGLLTLFLLCERRFRRLAARGLVGPAVVGLSWPRMVVPADYETRFTAPERRLIRQHEQTHVVRGDPHANLVIAGVQAIAWFNPLVHLASRSVRLDQELACDAAVIERNPESRRLYGETLVKAQSTGVWSAFACALTDGTRHPLEVRLAFLRRPPLSVRQYVAGATLVGAVALMTALCVWALAPETMGAGQTPMVQAMFSPDG